MKAWPALVCSVIFVCAAAALLAHPFTFKGTVASAAPTKVSVNLIDDKTKKPIVQDFEIDKETKILRGDAVVTFAAARIQKGEQVSVTVNLDDGGEGLADVIRLSAKK